MRLALNRSMQTKRSRLIPPNPITRAQFVALRRDVDRAVAAVRDLDSVRRECETNLRRCAELQFEIDRLKVLLTPHAEFKSARRPE